MHCDDGKPDNDRSNAQGSGEYGSGINAFSPPPAIVDGRDLETTLNAPKQPPNRTSKRKIALLCFLATAVIVAAVVGGVKGSKKKHTVASAIASGDSKGNEPVPITKKTTAMPTNTNTATPTTTNTPMPITKDNSPLIFTGPSASNGVPNFTTYANYNTTEHQLQFNQLSTQGYRMISLSVYGQPPNHLYAAVWVQRSGPSYVAIHEASATQYQSFFDTNTGYVSTFITVTGPPGGEIFAGVMEQNGVNNWYQSCGLTTAQYEAKLASYVSTGYILKSFTEYGSASDRLYCGLWYHNDQNLPFNTFVDESYDDYQATFNNQVANAGWRPGYLSISEDHAISSEFVNTSVGSWVARHGITTSDLQSELQAQLVAGLYPIHLQGGGTGDNINFAGIWAQQDISI